MSCIKNECAERVGSPPNGQVDQSHRQSSVALSNCPVLSQESTPVSHLISRKWFEPGEAEHIGMAQASE